MKGKVWLILGALGGIAIGLGKLPYLAGAAGSLADTAQRSVGTGGLTLIHDAAAHGAPRRLVDALTAVIGVLVPGLTAMLLVLAARLGLSLRFAISAIFVVLGGVAFVYLPHGKAAGVAVLALAAAGVAAVATGPLVATPLAALAALIATTYLPRLVAGGTKLAVAPTSLLHEALFSGPGTPVWLRVVVLVVAALPFAAAARLVLN